MALAHSRFDIQLQRITSDIQTLMNHPFVTQFVKKPEIDLFQLHVTYVFLSTIGISEDQIEKVCIPMTLIQMGLDLHEQVSNQGQKDEKAIKQKQLTVLSGDHYCSYYYYYLSMHGELKAIQRWAKTIETINEMKAELIYPGQPLGESGRLHKFCTIKRVLIESVLDEYQADSIWYSIYAQFTELRVSCQQGLDRRESIEMLIAQTEELLENAERVMIQEELQPWLEQIRQELLVIEP